MHPENEQPARNGLGSRLLRLLLRGPVMVLVALYFLLDDVVLAAFRPLFRRIAQWRLVQRLYLWLRRQNPYVTLVLFAVPFIILEPPKMLALLLIGLGHFSSGLTLLLSAHLLSIVVIERLFHVTRPTLLQIGWFAWGYGKVTVLRDWAIGHLKATGIWHATMRMITAVKVSLRVLTRQWRRVTGR